MDSSFTTQNISSSASSSQASSDIEITSNQSLSVNTTTSSQYKNQPENQPTYQLPSNNSAYIFQHNLFTRSLLPINYNKERQMLVQCTTCSYKKVESIKGFQASNFARHYKRKHPNIAYNKESEKTRKIKSTKPTTLPQDFFNKSLTTTESRKRIRQNTITEFDENEAYTKILTFLIDNNLSFNILNSDSFKDLLNYYNKSTLTINRHKIKTILNNTYDNILSTFNTQLQQNIESQGLFSLTLDIWTSKVSQD